MIKDSHIFTGPVTPRCTDAWVQSGELSGDHVAGRGEPLLGLFSEHLDELGGSMSRMLQQRIHEWTQRRRVEHVVWNRTVAEVSVRPDSIWPDGACPHRQVRQHIRRSTANEYRTNMMVITSSQA